MDNFVNSINATLLHQFGSKGLTQIYETLSYKLQELDCKQEVCISPENLIRSVSFSHFVSKYKLQLPTEQQFKELILKTIRQ